VLMRCWRWYNGCMLCCLSGCYVSRWLVAVIVGIGIPDGRFVVQGDVGVGMLKWQTSGSPCLQGEPRPFGSPREAGGTLRRGAIVNFDCAVGIKSIYEDTPSKQS